MILLVVVAVLLLQAASLSLLHYPLLNSSLSSCERELVYHSDHNIGVAMDTAKGLLVPVIKRVQDKSILQIAKAGTTPTHPSLPLPTLHLDGAG